MNYELVFYLSLFLPKSGTTRIETRIAWS